MAELEVEPLLDAARSVTITKAPRLRQIWDLIDCEFAMSIRTNGWPGLSPDKSIFVAFAARRRSRPAGQWGWCGGCWQDRGSLAHIGSHIACGVRMWSDIEPMLHTLTCISARLCKAPFGGAYLVET